MTLRSSGKLRTETGRLRTDGTTPGVAGPTVVSFSTNHGEVFKPSTVSARDLGTSVAQGLLVLWIFGDTFGPGLFRWTTADYGFALQAPGSIQTLANNVGTDGFPEEFVVPRLPEDPDGTRYPMWPDSVLPHFNGSDFIVYYQKVRHQTNPNRFTAQGAYVADVPNQSRTLNRGSGNEVQLWTGAGMTSGNCISPFDGHIYLFTTSTDNAGPKTTAATLHHKCARVPWDQYKVPASYRYWNGTTWVADEGAASNIQLGGTGFDRLGGMGGLTVSWNAYLNKYVMVHTGADVPSSDLCIRTADAPQGPWSRPTKLSIPPATASDEWGVYTGREHAWAQEDNGRVIWCTYHRALPGFLTGELRIVRVAFGPEPDASFTMAQPSANGQSYPLPFVVSFEAQGDVSKVELWRNSGVGPLKDGETTSPTFYGWAIPVPSAVVAGTYEFFGRAHYGDGSVKETPARTVTLTSDPGVPAAGTDWVIASTDSPQAWKDRADFTCNAANASGACTIDNSATAGDEVELHAAWAAAVASGTRKTVTLAPGNYYCNWSMMLGNAYASALRVPTNSGARITTKGIRGYTRIASVVHPTNFYRATGSNGQLVNDGNQHNRFVWVPGANANNSGHLGNGTVVHTFQDLTFDGRAAAQAAGTTLANLWSMDGLREHGSSGFLLDNCVFQNFRGTAGQGSFETSSIYLMRGTMRNCVVRSTDGGRQATAVHLALDTGGLIEDCQVIGRVNGTGARVINHGFAENRQTNGLRRRLKASGLTGSGLRSEQGNGCLAHDIETWDNVHGIISQSTNNHTVHTFRSWDNDQWGFGALRVSNLTIGATGTTSYLGSTTPGHTAGTDANAPDIRVFDDSGQYAGTGANPSTINTPGTLNYVTRHYSPNGPNPPGGWPAYGL